MSSRTPLLLITPLLLLADPAHAQHRFLVLMGGADAEVRQWSGSVASESAGLVAPHHFAHDESFSAKSFAFTNARNGLQNMAPQDEATYAPVNWKGVIVDVDAPAQTSVRITTNQGDISFRPAQVRYTEPLALLDGRVQVHRTPRTTPVGQLDTDEDYPALAVDGAGQPWLGWIADDGTGDSLQAAPTTSSGGADKLAGGGGDRYQVALAPLENGGLLAVWSAIAAGQVHLFARERTSGAWGPERQLTSGPGPDTYPRMATATGGAVYLTYQTGGKHNSDIALLVRDPAGEWGKPIAISEHPANDWEPNIAINSRGEAAIAWDSYRHGQYDIFLRRYAAGKLSPVQRITTSPDFEAHVSLAYDHRDRLWMAWDNGGANWGKDTYGINGIQRGESGTYFERQVQIRVLDRGRISRPVPPIEASIPFGDITGSRMGLGVPSGKETFTEYPQLIVDGKGRVWCRLRTRTIGRANPPPLGPRAILPYWDDKLVLFDGHKWSKPILLPSSSGRGEQRSATAVGPEGNLWIATASDGLNYQASDERFWQYDLHVGKVDLDLVPGGPITEEFFVGAEDLAEPLTVSDEEPALQQPLWKRYQMELGGEKYYVTWGDLHRHTELSFDGHSDGSLYDAYRYAIDAARMDFLGPSEHLLPEKSETAYVWRMVDKAVDIYKLPGAFYPLLNYERTVKFPDGHRNIVWRGRGYSPVKIRLGDSAAGTVENDMVQLWNELKSGGKLKAISIPHTTATQMGTDWRYNDEEVERLVEMFQGNRDSYEYYGAPRGAVAEQILVGGYITSGQIKKEGFVWEALAKGYKMGFIASSDHRSTHMSYAAVYTPERTYDDIWDSLRARRTYAATENIIVDFQSEEHAMGSEFSTANRPRLDIRVIGTTDIAQIDIIKDNEIVYTAHPDIGELSFTYTDATPKPGEQYYYVRVIQSDNNMAWASPIWITYTGN